MENFIKFKGDLMKHHLKWIAAVLALGLSLTACGGASSSSAPSSEAQASASAQKQAVVQFGTDPDSLDPALNSTVDGAEMLLHSFEALTRVDQEGRIVPGQAESWEVSEDGMTWTFHLRQGLKWSDGSDLTAADYVYSWQRMADPNTAAPYAATVLEAVKNFEPISYGEMDPAELGVSAPDANTFVVELEYPCSYFDKVVSVIASAPVCQTVVEEAGEAWALDPSTYVSNGAFTMTEWVPGSHITYAKNPHYWDADSVKLDGLKFLLTADENAAYASYETGEADLVISVPTEEIPSLRENADFHMEPNTGLYYLVFQTQKAPFDNADVRRALSLAVDRSYVAENLMQNTYSAAGSLVGPGIPDADGVTPFQDNANGGEEYISTDPADAQANLEEARQLLADAGYPNGEGFPVVEYLIVDSGYNKVLAEYLQSAWGELGITVEVREAEWQSLVDSYFSGDFDVTFAGWSCDYADPSCLLNLFCTENGNNIGLYSNPEYDACMETARTTTDVEERFAAMHAAEDILMEDMPFVPVAFYNDYWMQSPDLTGVWHSASGYWFFHTADLAA